jgi:hypothetical protein
VPLRSDLDAREVEVGDERDVGDRLRHVRSVADAVATTWMPRYDGRLT